MNARTASHHDPSNPPFRVFAFSRKKNPAARATSGSDRTQLRIRIGSLAVVLVAFTGCTTFDPVPRGVCGNGIVEDGEDCDSSIGDLHRVRRGVFDRRRLPEHRVHVRHRRSLPRAGRHARAGPARRAVRRERLSHHRYRSRWHRRCRGHVAIVDRRASRRGVGPTRRARLEPDADPDRTGFVRQPRRRRLARYLDRHARWPGRVHLAVRHAVAARCRQPDRGSERERRARYPVLVHGHARGDRRLRRRRHAGADSRPRRVRGVRLRQPQ